MSFERKYYERPSFRVLLSGCPWVPSLSPAPSSKSWAGTLAKEIRPTLPSNHDSVYQAQPNPNAPSLNRGRFCVQHNANAIECIAHCTVVIVHSVTVWFIMLSPCHVGGGVTTLDRAPGSPPAGRSSERLNCTCSRHKGHPANPTVASTKHSSISTA